MSVSMYWYKPPSARKELGSSYDIKWPIAKRWGQMDGSCHENFMLDESAVPFLEGLLASGHYPDAEKLIEDIRKYGSVEVEYK